MKTENAGKKIDKDLEKYVNDPESGLKLVRTLLEANLTDDQLRELIEMIKKEPVKINEKERPNA